MTTTKYETETWFRIGKESRLYPGKPFFARWRENDTVWGLIELGGRRGWATAERGIDIAFLTPMAGPPVMRGSRRGGLS